MDMIELPDSDSGVAVRNHLSEMAPKFDNGRRLEHPVLVHNKASMVQGEDIALYQEEIGTVFHW